MFSGTLEHYGFFEWWRRAIDYFEKDTVEDTYIAAREDAPPINMNQGAFIDKEYDGYVV